MNLERRAEVEQSLRLSLLNNTDDFIMVYQPQVTCDENRQVVGAEALLRWKGPGSEQVGPADFIPVAEESGLIHPLDHMVCELAARQIRDWGRDRIVVPISVNVSVMSLQTKGFARDVLRRLEAHSIPTSLFRVEILETVRMGKSPEVEENLVVFSGSGVHISIDDFGTGHASLSCLKSLPVNDIKMDRSLVENLGSDATSDHALAAAILAMARALGVDVVAEGVEAEAQFDWLVKNGCARVQGFLVGRPMDPKPISDLVEKDFLMNASDTSQIP